jgi:hypothetical protein
MPTNPTRLPITELREAIAAERILSYQAADGSFHGNGGPGHDPHTVLGALDLLKEPVPESVGPPAPKAPSALREWMGNGGVPSNRTGPLRHRRRDRHS